MKRECSITVDEREQKFGLQIANNLITNFNRKNIQIKEIDVGDYVIELDEYRYVLERKSAIDFAASMKDGRLERQTQKLGNEDNGILLLHGHVYNHSIWNKTNMKIPDSITRLITGLNIKRIPNGEKLQVIWVPDETQVAVVIDYIATKIETGKIVLSTKIRAKKENKSKITEHGLLRHKTILMDIFMRLDRMSWKVAEQLIEKCDGNFEIFMNWSEQDMINLDINGLGPTLVARLYDQFHATRYRSKEEIKKIKKSSTKKKS